MDNCLASNSETGGVGCDNMTMSVIALLNGKTLEEWYNMIAERVANGGALRASRVRQVLIHPRTCFCACQPVARFDVPVQEWSWRGKPERQADFL